MKIFSLKTTEQHNSVEIREIQKTKLKKWRPTMFIRLEDSVLLKCQLSLN